MHEQSQTGLNEKNTQKKRTISGLYTGHDQARGLGQKLFEKSRVESGGWGKEVFVISRVFEKPRVESCQVRRCS